MNNILDVIKKRRIYFDGGTGTYLQANGLKPGEEPELWNISHPNVIENMHRAYFCRKTTSQPQTPSA